MTLSNDYLDQGRTIFTDRYYTSIFLAQTLEMRQTAFTGTCVSNRKQLASTSIGISVMEFRLADGEVCAYRRVGVFLPWHGMHLARERA